MHELEDKFAEKVRRRLGELGETPFSMERKANLPADAIRSVIRPGEKRARPSLSRLQEICEALGIEFAIAPPSRAMSARNVRANRLAMIPRYDAQGAAGDGVINLDAPPIDHIAFPRDWLVSQGLRASTSFLMTVTGASMEPTLYDGDLVMVDRARREARSGRIYVFTDPADHGTRIKRIDLASGGVIIRSDNREAADPAIEMWLPDRADELLERIIGEVVWWGHTDRN